MATTNCVATFGLVGPRAGISIGICVPETVTEPIPVVRNSANRTTITMTITLRRCRSSSICSKNVIRRSLGRSSSEATFATAVIAAKRARLMYFPQMQGCESPSERVAVLGQRIRGVAVPADFPVPELFLVRERDGAHPLCTLVGVALRHEEPDRTPVFDRKRLAVPLLRVEPGDDAQVEPRPFPNLPLPGREKPLRRHPNETIEIPRYKSLCQCSARIFGVRLHVSSRRDASPRHREKTRGSCAPTKV